MSSFKKADGIIDSIQKQATGLRTLDGSAIEDFLSIAGYEEPAGGGGSDDYTIAKVTFINESTLESLAISVPNIFAEELYSILTKDDIAGGDQQDVVLYKGSVKGGVTYALSPVTLTCTGDITINDNQFTITGDGVITISNG